MAFVVDRWNGKKSGAGKRWEIRYRDPHGQERSKRFVKESEARRFKAGVEVAKANTEWIDPRLAKTRFGDYAVDWFDGLTHVRPGTRANIASRLDRHILPAFGQMTLGSIRTSDVRAWVSSLSDKGLSPSSVVGTYRNFFQIAKSAAADGLISRSPCIDIKLPSQSKREEMLFLEPHQVSALAETINPRFRALVYTAAYTGMRWGELAALKLPRLNLLKGVADVAEALSEVKGVLYLGPTKTGKRRTVSLPRFLCEMLGEHIANYSAPEGFAFTSAQGGPIRRNFYRRQFKPAVVAAGLDSGLRFHDLRHTCAALLIAQGAHPKEIQERLGHSTIRVTFDRYGHLFPGLDERLKDGLDAAFREADAGFSRVSSGS